MDGTVQCTFSSVFIAIEAQNSKQQIHGMVINTAGNLGML